MSVKPGMGPKEIAELHYKLLVDNNKEEWLKTVRKSARGKQSRSNNWWKVGRGRVEKKGWTYKFRHEDDRFHTDNKRKYFFYRLDKDGEETSKPVPVTVEKDPDDNDEWRVDVSSW